MKKLVPLIFCLVLAGCVRSTMFHRDQDYMDDASDSYYTDDSFERSGVRADRIKQPKKKILVLGFWNDTPMGDESIGVFAAEELKRLLSVKKKVIFPDEKTTTAVTHDFVEGDRIQTSQLIREGKRVGVNAVVVGRISKITFRQDREEVGILREAKSAVSVDLEMKVFDVASGREVHQAKRSGNAANIARILFDDDALSTKNARIEIAKDAVAEAIRKMTGEVMLSLEKMDWQGRIAKLLGNKVYINAGRASGLLAGDILKVMSPGEEIVDPITKAYLGRSEGMLKGTLEVSEFIGQDSSMTLIHTGGNFQEGDVVRLY